jgi:hypothetical protein
LAKAGLRFGCFAYWELLTASLPIQARYPQAQRHEEAVNLDYEMVIFSRRSGVNCDFVFLLDECVFCES